MTKYIKNISKHLQTITLPSLIYST